MQLNRSRQFYIWYFLVVFLVLLSVQRYRGDRAAEHLAFGHMSAEAAARIDRSVRELVHEAFERAPETLAGRHEVLQQSAHALPTKDILVETKLPESRESLSRDTLAAAYARRARHGS